MVNVAERPNTLDDTIQEIHLVLYSNMYTIVVIPLVVPYDVTVITERLSGLTLRHVHKDKTLDVVLF